MSVDKSLMLKSIAVVALHVCFYVQLRETPSVQLMDANYMLS